MSGTGEARCEGGVETVHGLLERLGAPAIDVACGRETPIAGDHAFPDEWRDAVDDGSGLELPSHSRQPFDGTAVELIEKTAQDFDGLRVLTLGPLTNLAEALDSNPDLAERLESVYAMGGALFVPGNVRFGGPPDNQVAEWNIYVDPTSAQMVIDSGVPVRLISLDGTSQVPVTPEYAERVAQEATGPGGAGPGRALCRASVHDRRELLPVGSAGRRPGGRLSGWIFQPSASGRRRSRGRRGRLHSADRGLAERRVPELGRSGGCRGRICSKRSTQRRPREKATNTAA